MSSEPAIVTRDLGKEYLIRHEDPRMRTFVEAAGELMRSPLRRFRELRGSAEQHERFWALRAIDLVIGEGELVGLIGKNGAGKSTLLRILSRITTPTTGRAELRGSVRSLLEVGTGFHPELTGRENVFLNGAVLGMKRDEIRKRFDEIVAFAEVDRFLDTPLKRYSSGMFVRLAFAVAAHLEPDILLVDEVLAVGDAPFQKRCIDKISSIARSGRTVIVVSHNLRTIGSLTSRCILLDAGTIGMDGPTDRVIERYLESTADDTSLDLGSRTDRAGHGLVRFLGAVIGSAASGHSGSVATGDQLTISLELEPSGPARQVEITIHLNGWLGERLTTLSTVLTHSGVDRLDRPTTARCTVPRVPLAPGQYNLELFCLVDGTLSDWVQNAATLVVEPGEYHGRGVEPHHGIGVFHLDQQWSFEQDENE